IETDSTPLEEPKNPDSCNVFGLYKLLADVDQIKQMREKYLAGGFGYGHAKQELYELILEKFKTQREKFNYYMEHLDEIDDALATGAEKAKLVAAGVLQKVRTKMGY